MIPLPDDYTVRLVDMPVREGGMISEDPDGHINVYINARLSSTGQHTAAYHEWEHWYNDDLNNDTDIREVEGRKRLPTLKRARDLTPGRYMQPADAEEWKDDIIHRLQRY